MTGQFETCSICSRKELQKGKVNRLEVALDENNEHPIITELENFINSPRKKDDRYRRYADLMQVLAEFVHEPLGMLEKDLNYLRDDIWELKAGTLRILFGEGNCQDHESGSQSARTLTLPTWVKQPDPATACGRATNAYEKDGKKAPRKRIDKAVGILREDKTR